MTFFTDSNHEIIYKAESLDKRRINLMVKLTL